MFEFVSNLLNYTGSSINNVDTYIVYTCCASLLVMFALSVDFVYKIFLRFLPKDIR